MKFRRKTELGTEKRERMKTGGGSYNADVSVDPELDSTGLNIEIKDAMDSDAIYFQGGTYHLSGEDLIPNTISGPDATVDQPPPDLPDDVAAEIPFASNRRKREDKEETLRKKRILQHLTQEEELHRLRVEEQKLKIMLTQNQIECSDSESQYKHMLNEMNLKHLREIHSLNVQNVELEIKLKQSRLDREAESYTINNIHRLL